MEVVLLDKKIHKREDFECTDEELTSFLKKRANQEHEKHISDTYVLVENRESQVILGYFTLSNSRISLSHLPDEHKKHLPNYPGIGTVLLGRMARDKKTPAGFGGIILREAIKKSLEKGSFYVLEVVAKNDALVNYYISWGFICFLDDKTHLFLPRKTIANLIKE